MLAHSSLLVVGGGSLLAALYLLTWSLVDTQAELFRQLWFLPGVGVFGAIIANASGTGGGVVFVPVFHALCDQGAMALGPLEGVAVSMGSRRSG